jgi:DNA-binding transcriptional LysR family regulator
MQLTEAGSILLARIEGPLRQLERAAAEVRALSGIVSGHVAIGMMPTVAEVIAGDLAQQIAEGYPEVQLRIVEGYDGHLMEWMQRGTIDAALLYGPAADLHLRTRPLFTEELRLVARPGVLTETTEVATRPLILPSRPHGLRGIVEAAAQVAHVSLSVRFEVDSYTLLKDLAVRGLGCAFLPRSACAEEEGRVSTAAVRSPPLRRQVVLGLRPGPAPDRATLVMLALLDSILASAGDGKLFESAAACADVV